MGSGRDKRKAAKEKKQGPTAGKGTEKTERKTVKNEVGVITDLPSHSIDLRLFHV